MIHTTAWLVWLLAALIALIKTRNPIYLIQIILCVLFISYTIQHRETQMEQGEGYSNPIKPWRIVTLIIIFSSIFNAAFSHHGDTNLFYLPDWLPFLGGSITLEALVYGAIKGLVLSGIFSVFYVLNLALPVHRLIRLIPRAFYPVAVVTSIAITFVPATIRQFHQIREAQAIRGHRVRGLRDWLPLIMPLIIGGLERALGLAEAMSARGFAGSDRNYRAFYPRMLMIVGLLLVLAGWIIRLMGVWGYYPLILITLGLLVVIGMLSFLGRQIPRSVYIQERWSWSDLPVLIGAILVITAFLIPLPIIDQTTFTYNPYPSINLPSIDLLVCTLIFGLLVPGLTTIASTIGDNSTVTGADGK